MALLVNNTSQNRTRVSRTITVPTLTSNTIYLVPSGGYTPGYVDVFKNRERLNENEYTATDGTTIVLASNATPSDTVTIVCYTVLQTDDVVRKSGDSLAGTLRTQDLIPDSDATHSLGNTTYRYADLYLSGNSIFLGGVVLSANDTSLIVANTTGGAITLSGNVILGTGTTGDYVANVTAGAGISGSASGEGSTPTIAVVANNGIIANSFGVFVDGANGISVTADGVNVLANSGISVTSDGVFAVGANGVTVTSSGINVLANNGVVSNSSGVFVKAGTGVTVNATGVHVGQSVETTSNVTFERVTSNTASIATANITTVNATTVGVTTINAVNVVATGNLTVTGTQSNLTNVNANNLTVTANITSNVGTFATMVVTGNLTVNGTTTYVQTTDLNVGDNKIVLNSDLANTAPPTESISIIANRGSAANVALTWNETTDKWTFTNDGSTYYNVASNTDVATAYSNATSYTDTKAGDAYSNAVSAASSDASGKAATAYSNAAAYADTKAAAAYSNASNYADTKAGDAYTNATAFAANASNISSGTVNNARLNAANTTQAGIVQLVDSTTNTSVTIAATANSVKTALELAVANAATAYTNAASYADTKAGQAYSNAVAYSSNATNLSSGTVNNARLNSANTTQAGIVQLVDSTTNTSVTIAATANSVKTALDLAVANAATAYTNAASYADTVAATAYSNATAFAANASNISSGTLNTAHLPATANISTGINVGANINLSTTAINVGNSTVNSTITSSVITTANVVATNLSGNGASITSVDAATVGGNTAATLRSYTDTKAGDAYTNATSYADTKSNAAYSNAVSTAATDATNKAANAYSNATSYADTKAGQAYTNAVSYTDGVATTTYNNAAGYADTKASQAYSNAISYVDTGLALKANVANPTFTGNVTANVINVNQYIDFSNTASAPSKKEGRLFYDNTSKTMAYHVEEPDITMNIGQENWTRVYNGTGATIVDGSAVYITGATGGIPTIALADATDASKMDVIGLATHSIENGTYGYVTSFGKVTPINTTGMSVGDKVYVSANTPGGITTIAPTYPNFALHLGEVIVVGNSSVGSVLVDLEPHYMPTLRVEGNARIDGDLTIAGDLTLLGNTTSTAVTNLSVDNSFIYLAAGDAIANSSFTGSGLDDAEFRGVFEGTTTTTYYVKIVNTGIPDRFSWSKDDFATTEAANVAITGGLQTLDNGISIEFQATTGHILNDKWYGTAAPSNLDAGFVANYNDGTYAHAGVFRDASDGKFKAFKGYTPEPGASIDTGHASFQFADFQANTFHGNLIGNVTGNADTATALATARKIELTGPVTGNVNFAGTTNVQIATTLSTLTQGLVVANTLSTGNTTVNGTLTVTGTVNFDANTLFVDVANSRVGILTGAPTAPLTIGEGGATLTTPMFQATDTQNSYIQVALQNLSNGAYASADYVITADNGTDLTNYLDIGLASSGFNYPDFNVIGPLDGYIFNQGGRMLVGTGANKDIVFFTGNVVAGSEKAYIYANGDAKFLGKVVVNNSVTATLLVANVDASNIVSGTIANARLNAANTTQAGIVQLVDSVTNTSIVIAATANSAKLAYDTAISANTRAASAYSNATAYADTAAATAYTNAVAYAAANSYVNSTFAPKADPTFTGTVTSANVTVNGTLVVNTGITVNRGGSPNVAIRWDESIDRWVATNDGTTYANLAIGAAGATLTANNTDTANYYLPMSNGTSGSWTNAVVASSLTYIPSTGTLSIGNTTVNTTVNSTAIAVNGVTLGSGNSFGTIVVGNTNIVAAASNTALTLAAGAGVILTPNTSSKTVTVNLSNFDKQSHTGNGSNTDFGLTYTSSNDDILVFVNGVYFHPEEDYTVANNVLSFTTAPPNLAQIRIRFLRPDSGLFSTLTSSIDLNA